MATGRKGGGLPLVALGRIPGPLMPPPAGLGWSGSEDRFLCFRADFRLVSFLDLGRGGLVPNRIVLPLSFPPGEDLPADGLGDRDRFPGFSPSRFPPPLGEGGRPSGLGTPVGLGGNRQEA
jgi:hypothetical protein